MAYSRVTQLGDGVTNTFTVNFPLGVIDDVPNTQFNITCYVGDEATPRTITWVSENIAEISGAAPGLGVAVRFDRVVVKDELISDFENTAVMIDDALNNASKQAIMIAMEALDGKISPVDDINMNGHKITNLGSADNPTDAVNKQDVIDLVNTIPIGPPGPQGIPGLSGADGADGVVQAIVAGGNITVDNTDPAFPVISATGGGTGAVNSVVAGSRITVDNTDPANPVVSLNATTVAVRVFNLTELAGLDVTKHRAAVLQSGDGREGWFFWRPGDYSSFVAQDTRQGIFVQSTLVPSTSGAWTRFPMHYRGMLNSPKLYGALGGGVANNDTAPLLAAPALIGIGGKTIIWPKDSHYLNDVLTIPAGATLKGSTGKWKGYCNNRFDFYNQGSTIVCGPSGKIQLSAGASLEDIIIIKEGISPHVTQAQSNAWTGIAVEGIGDNWCVDGATIFGFEWAIHSTAGQRMNIQNVQGDNRNGIYIAGNYDVGLINNIHFWPFLSAYSESAPIVTANRLRSGRGIWLQTVSDWTKITNAFVYGYFEGYRLEDVGAVTIVNSSADSSVNDIRAGSIGFNVLGGSSNIRMSAIQAAAYGTGINLNGGGAGLFASLDGASVWACNSVGIRAGLADNTIGSGTRVRCLASHTNAIGMRIDQPGGILRLSDTTFEAFAGANQIAVELTGSHNRGNIMIDDATLRFTNCGSNPVRGGGTLTMATVASAGSVALPANGDLFLISGSTNIGNFVNNLWEGRQITTVFSSALTLVNSASLILQGGVNAVVTPNSAMTFVRRGGAWIELNRSFK